MSVERYRVSLIPSTDDAWLYTALGLGTNLMYSSAKRMQPGTRHCSLNPMLISSLLDKLEIKLLNLLGKLKPDTSKPNLTFVAWPKEMFEN